MQCVYVRHGKTEYSLKNLFAGRKDIPIVGIDVTLMADAITLVKSSKPDLLLHSPLLRAVQTSELFIKEFSFKKIISEPLLIERDFGCYEGLEKTKLNRESLEFEKSVEKIEALEARAISFIEKYKGQNILVVGHSAFYRALIKFADSPEKGKLNCCESTKILI
ncbi:histidine phosphatase family protein [Vibrio fluvialis]|jgi:broad specificity phosphatase PhoE|uniref:histidine phosphatase family protein n=1 Tax=Vibrio fluvialis TaxID=676 RepID=UPI001C9D8E52|nr:histidine phosphatase family protein [Vibrio fluvialis]